MGYLVDDIIYSLRLTDKITRKSSAVSSVKYVCDTKLIKGTDYTKNEGGLILIELSGVEKLKRYYAHRGYIKGDEKVVEHLQSTPAMPGNINFNKKETPMSPTIANKGHHVVYALQDPNDLSIKYVGKSKNIIARYKGHNVITHQSIKENREKCEWVQSLLDKGQKPFLTILEVCSYKDLPDREKYWTEHFLSQGYRLFNIKFGDRTHSNLTIIKAV